MTNIPPNPPQEVQNPFTSKTMIGLVVMGISAWVRKHLPLEYQSSAEDLGLLFVQWVVGGGLIVVGRTFARGPLGLALRRWTGLMLMLPLLLICGGCLPQNASPALKLMDYNGKLTDGNNLVATLVREKTIKKADAQVYQQVALEVRDALDKAEAKLLPDGSLPLGQAYWLDRVTSAFNRLAPYLLHYQQLKRSPGSSVPTTQETSDLWKPSSSLSFLSCFRTSSARSSCARRLPPANNPPTRIVRSFGLSGTRLSIT